MMNRFFTLLFAATCLTAVGQVPEYLVSSNPVMYFDFDGNAIEGVNGDEPLLPSGDIEYIESAERHVLELNGSGVHLYHPDADFPSFQTVSMCIEVRLDEFGSGLSENLVPILSKWESTGTQNNEWNVFETDGQIWLWWTESSNPGSAISFTHNWTAGEWHTICFEVGARAALWIDGEFVEEKIRDEFGSSNRLFRLGDWNNFQNSSYRTFDGAIDRLAIWSSLLSDNTSQEFHIGEAAVSGCTNPEACNYDNEANLEDGSCVACDVATTFCGEGTAWDPETQTCIVANPADINFDGCVQLNDLLDLLSAYGMCFVWQCGDPLEYQGYDYATVQIGEQCWFAENLRAELYENGDAIPANLSDNEWSSTTSGAVAFYNGDPSNFDAFGRLYNWYAVADVRGLCPSGWHVPTDEEWMAMEVALGMSENAANTTGWRGTDQATQMKTDYGWHGDGSGTNSSGFAGLPGGYRHHDGFFSGFSFDGNWWSSSSDGDNAWHRFLFYDFQEVSRGQFSQRRGVSVRCIQAAE